MSRVNRVEIEVSHHQNIIRMILLNESVDIRESVLEAQQWCMRRPIEPGHC